MNLTIKAVFVFTALFICTPSTLIRAEEAAATSRPKAGDFRVPKLEIPANGAVLANGSNQREVEYGWSFRWKPVTRASAYELEVKHPNAKFPMIKKELPETQYKHIAKGGYTALLKDWKWKVRAKVNGKWGDWSQEQTFSVTPVLP